MGSTGPREEMTDEGGQGLGRPWATDFPTITIRDMVRAQQKLVESLGIARLLAVIGGSMGGMQVLEWAATFPRRSSPRHPSPPPRIIPRRTSPSTRWAAPPSTPTPTGTRAATARRGASRRRASAWRGMVAHITYMSEDSLTRKFGRKLQAPRR
jgi:homoserine O-acetyltransferase